MSGIRWEEPPEARSHTANRSTKWGRIAAELRAHPGEWAVVDVKPDPHLSAQTAMCIKTGIYASMPKGEFEAVSRLVDGEARVYARYIGGAS